MSNLLTNAERQQIEQGYKDVLDTYSRTPIVLRIASGSVEVWNEDRADVTYTDYSFDAIVTYGKADSQDDANMGGVVDKTVAEIVVHLDTLQALGLLSADYMPLIDEAKDAILIQGIPYIINEVAPQGHGGQLLGDGR